MFMTKNTTYDALDRLTEQSDAIRSLVEGYDYDPNSNRIERDDGIDSEVLSYEADSNRLSTIDGSGIVLDASGRTLSDHQGREYSYNNAGRLQILRIDGQIVGQYTYNAAQLRTQKLTSSATRLFHYDLMGNLIAESDDQGNLIQEYIYADGERVATFAVPNQTVTNTNSPNLENLVLHTNADDLMASDLSAKLSKPSSEPSDSLVSVLLPLFGINDAHASDSVSVGCVVTRPRINTKRRINGDRMASQWLTQQIPNLGGYHRWWLRFAKLLVTGNRDQCPD